MTSQGLSNIHFLWIQGRVGLERKGRISQGDNNNGDVAWLREGWCVPRQAKTGQSSPDVQVLSCSLEATSNPSHFTVIVDSWGNCQGWHYRKLPFSQWGFSGYFPQWPRTVMASCLLAGCFYLLVLASYWEIIASAPYCFFTQLPFLGFPPLSYTAPLFLTSLYHVRIWELLFYNTPIIFFCTPVFCLLIGQFYGTLKQTLFRSRP